MIYGIPIVKSCPACGNGILIKQAGRNECQGKECSREAAVYCNEAELNALLVPALVKELDEYKKALNNVRHTHDFKMPKLQRMNNSFAMVPQ